ncbi:MAG: DAK2 domain-containing protein [bacterium]|nr:DAK2 domain-containing protein [bacterium]
MGQHLHQKIFDGHLLKQLFMAGLMWLDHHQERVNWLNVFPVPDGDTGKNMVLTLKQGYEAIRHSDEAHAGVLCGLFARGALLGARGNSGVILSQWLAGWAESVTDAPTFDLALLSKAFANSVKQAYGVVMTPTEGTILTVAREASEALETYAQTGDDWVVGMEVLYNAAKESLAKTPDLLPILKTAGKVDSGGQGLVFILEGMVKALRGEPITMRDEDAESPLWVGDALPADDEDGYGYDVQFLMHGQNMDLVAIREAMNIMGWSVLVAGDSSLIKVHIHVHNPGEPLSYAIAHCEALDDIVVENMQLQYERLYGTQPLRIVSTDGVAVIAVASGRGWRDIFYSAGVACVIEGGQTMNPSTDDFLKVIKSLDNTDIILLPNNKNVFLAAQQTVKEAQAINKRVIVINTQSMPQGISAMLGYSDTHEDGVLDDIADAMREAFSDVITGEITTAIHASQLPHLDVKEGQWIGLVDDQLVVAENTIEMAMNRLLTHTHIQTHELVTLYYGVGLSLERAQEVMQLAQANYPTLQFELVYGGQHLYPIIMSIE